MEDQEEGTWDATQSAILDAVATCAAQYGFSGLTTRRIAKEAGVNEVTLYRRFGNKAALINAAFQREADTMQSQAIYYTGDVEADLRRIVETLVQLGNRRRFLLPMILLELPRNEELRNAVKHPQQAVGGVVSLLSRYQQEGKLQQEPPLAAFVALVGPIMFTLLVGSILPDTSQLLEPTTIVRNFLEGHRAIT